MCQVFEADKSLNAPEMGVFIVCLLVWVYKSDLSCLGQSATSTKLYVWLQEWSCSGADGRSKYFHNGNQKL